MSLFFEIVRPQPIGTFRIEVRNPEFGDTYEFDRRQAFGETEGGSFFVQDLGAGERFYDASWSSLNAVERRRMEDFFGINGTNKRLRSFELGLFDNTAIAVRVGTEQGCSTGDGLTTGQFKCPLLASLGRARLEQNVIQFTESSRGRYTTSLRFRLLDPPCS